MVENKVKNNSAKENMDYYQRARDYFNSITFDKSLDEIKGSLGLCINSLINAKHEGIVEIIDGLPKPQDVTGNLDIDKLKGIYIDLGERFFPYDKEKDIEEIKKKLVIITEYH